jgi:hypothetical protein
MEKLALAPVGGGTFDYVMFSLSLNFFFKNFFFVLLSKEIMDLLVFLIFSIFLKLFIIYTGLFNLLTY